MTPPNYTSDFWVTVSGWVVALALSIVVIVLIHDLALRWGTFEDGSWIITLSGCRPGMVCS